LVAGRRIASVSLLALILFWSAAPTQGAQERPGVPPASAWTCPATHPIKGKFTPSSGERCIYHVPGGGFYDKTKPERCYATDDVARQDGCRRSKR
jgi:hypothetical protein